MNKFIPIEKMSKRKRREENKKRRGTWGDFNPVTRKPGKPNAYMRADHKRASNRKDDFFDSELFHILTRILSEYRLNSISSPCILKKNTMECMSSLNEKEMNISMENSYLYPQTPCTIPTQYALMANSLYHSLQGQYFVGYADNMFFEKDKSAWAALVNPVYSDVNLYVNVWTVSDLFEPPIRMQIWFNSSMPGSPTESNLVNPANMAIYPLPIPKVHILQASNAIGTPQGGTKGFVRRTMPGETIVSEEEGKFIIPPGGNFAIFLSNPEGADVSANVRVAFGWWEEKVCGYR